MTNVREFWMSSPDQLRKPGWPPVDIYRNRYGWLVKCDLAGVRRDEIRVTTAGSRLTISGVRRDWTVIEGQQAWSMEIDYSGFARTVELPCDLSRAKIDVDYRDGMLLIRIEGC
jgi:HSP20 family protein